MIVGLEMKGNWTLQDGRLRFLPKEIKVRGKPDTIPQELADGFLSKSIARHGGKFVMQINDGDEFERVNQKTAMKELR